MVENPISYFPENSGICLDMRSKRTCPGPTDPYWLDVEEKSYWRLVDHVSEGIYSRGINFYGIIPQDYLSQEQIRHSGYNCIDPRFTNVFITNNSFYDVYIIPPSPS